MGKELIGRRYFNSHPHKEDDLSCNDLPAVKDISTHILTRRMTLHSTMAFRNKKYFNSHPHKEDDATNLAASCGVSHFNSHPHKEDDS